MSDKIKYVNLGYPAYACLEDSGSRQDMASWGDVGLCWPAWLRSGDGAPTVENVRYRGAERWVAPAVPGQATPPLPRQGTLKGRGTHTLHMPSPTPWAPQSLGVPYSCVTMALEVQNALQGRPLPGVWCCEVGL